MLQRGHSGRAQIVSVEWMEQAFSKHVSLGPLAEVLSDGGYGYQVWTESSPSEAFVMWGHGGQFVWIVPALDLVVVGTQEWRGIGYAGALEQAEALARIIRSGILPAAG